jgi:hypothetical protein
MRRAGGVVPVHAAALAITVVGAGLKAKAVKVA